MTANDHVGAAKRGSMTIDGVRISNPGKIWWPDDGITKGDIARYYAGIAPLLLPWIDERPLTAERCPDGMRGNCFYQKDFRDELPASVPRLPIPTQDGEKTVNYVAGGSRATLLRLVNLGCIAIHTMNCQRGHLDQPDWLAFDLDPESGEFADAARAGLLLRLVLEEMNIVSFPKTTGGRGLHVLIPLRRGPDQDSVRAFAQQIARRLIDRAPELVTLEMSRGKREGRVFIDTLRNAFGSTIVAPHSVRHRPHAPVSTPLDWDEVTPDLKPERFTVRTIQNRLGNDPWARFWEHRQALHRLT